MRFRIPRSALVLLTAFASALSLPAQTLYWYPGGNFGGDGVWSTQAVDLNWNVDPDGLDPQSFWVNGRSAVLDGAGGTIQVENIVSFSNLIVREDYSLIPLINNQPITMAANSTIRMEGQLDGGGNPLGGVTLSLTNIRSPQSGTIDLVTDGTLILNATNTYTYEGRIIGQGTVIKTGSGETQFTQFQNFNGHVEIHGGVLNASGQTSSVALNDGFIPYDVSITTNAGLQGYTKNVLPAVGSSQRVFNGVERIELLANGLGAQLDLSDLTQANTTQTLTLNFFSNSSVISNVSRTLGDAIYTLVRDLNTGGAAVENYRDSLVRLGDNPNMRGEFYIEDGKTGYLGLLEGVGRIMKTGDGTLEVLAQNEAFTGDIIVGSGRLVLNNPTGETFANASSVSLGGASGTFVVAKTGGTPGPPPVTSSSILGDFGNANSARLVLGSDQTIRSLQPSNLTQTNIAGEPFSVSTDASRNSIIDLGAHTLIVIQERAGLYSGSIIGGGGTFIKDGEAELRLNGLNSHTGLTIARRGLLVVDSNAVQFSDIVIEENGRLAFQQDLGGTFSNNISGDAGADFIKRGIGTLELDGDLSPFEGNVVIEEGEISLTNPAGNTFPNAQSIQLLSSVNPDAPAVLRFNDSDQTIRNLFGEVNTVINIGSGNIIVVQDDDNIFLGRIVGTGDFIKQGASTLELGGVNTHQNTTIEEGAILLSGTMNQSTLTLAAEGTSLSIDNEDKTLRGLTGVAGSSLLMGEGNLTINQGFDSTFSGALEGSGDFIKQGVGNLTLDGLLNYTGLTRIAGGTLTIGAPLASSAIINNSELVFLAGPNLPQYIGPISGSGNVSVGGTGIFVLEGDLTYTGTTTINPGASLQLAASSTLGDIFNNGAIIFREFEDTTYSGNIQGIGDVFKRGPATLTLNGLNSYTGTTFIEEGGLIGNTNSLNTAIQLSADTFVAFNQTVDGIYNAVISGEGDVFKRGNARLTLSEVNTYTGETVIEAGDLRINHFSGDTIAASSGVRIEGGRLSLGALDQTIQNLSGSSNSEVNLNTATLTINQSEDTAFAGTVTGTGGLIKTGDGILLLSGNTNYAGNTVVQEGELQINPQGLGGGIQVDAGAVVALFNNDVNNTVIYNGVITGAGDVGKTGEGTLRLTQQQANTGGTLIREGILQVVSADTLNGTVQVLAPGFIEYDLAADGTLTEQVTGEGGLIKSGAGYLILTENLLYTGLTQINEGAIVMGGLADRLTNLSGLAGTIVDANNKTLVIDQNRSTLFAGSFLNFVDIDILGNGTLFLGQLPGDVTLQGDGILALLLSNNDPLISNVTFAPGSSATFNLDVVPGVSPTYSGIITGSGIFEKSGGGTLLLDADSPFTGETRISGGRLILSPDNLANTSLVNLVGAGTIVTFDHDDSQVFSAPITGLGDVEKDGLGDLRLDGLLTYTGATLVNAGRLILEAENATNTSGIEVNGINSVIEFSTPADQVLLTTVSGDGVLDKTGVGDLTLGTVQTLTGETRVSEGRLIVTPDQLPATSQINVVNADSTVAFTTAGEERFSAPIIGQGNVEKSGTGRVILDGDLGYSGATRITAGTLQLRGGAMDNTSGIELVTPDAVVDFRNSGEETLQAVVSGVGIFEKSGGGTLLLDADSPFTGETRISGGRLILSPNNLANTSLVNLAGAGTIVTFDHADSQVFAAPITGLGDVEKDGLGDLRLDGLLTYTGATLVNAGRLILEAENVTNTSGIEVNGLNSVIEFSTPADQVLLITVSGDGVLDKTGVGDLTLGTVQTLTGETRVSEGRLIVTPDQLPATSQINVVNADSTVAFTTGGEERFSAPIIGQGNVEKSGTGRVILDGDLGYTGATRITAGTLQLRGGAMDNTSGIELVTPDAVVDFRNSGEETLQAVVSGVGIFEKSGDGTLTLAGINTYSGSTRVIEGRLITDPSNLPNTSDFALGTNGTLELSHNSDENVSVPITGSGNLVKSGSGQLTLNGPATYTGSTTVAAGTLQLGTSGNPLALGSSQVSVQSGSRLTGAGSIAGNLVNQGRVSPGFSVGTINVGGNFTQGPGGSLLMEMESPTSADRINVAGTTTLAGNLTLAGLGGFVPARGTQYVFIQDSNPAVGSGIVGRFDTVTLDPTLATTNFLLIYPDSPSGTAGALTVVTTQQSFAEFAQSATQAAVATALDGLFNAEINRVTLTTDSALVTQIALTPTASLPGLFQTLAPSAYSSFVAVSFNTANQINQTLGERLATRRYDRAGPSINEWEAFLIGSGSLAQFGSGASDPNYDFRTFGSTVGIDREFGRNAVAGIAFTYTNSNVSIKGAGGSIKGDAFRGTLFGGSVINQWFYVNATASLGYNTYDVSRNVVGGSVTASPSALEYGASLSGGTVIVLTDNLLLTPMLGVDYNGINVDAFTESGGAPGSLAVRSINQNSVRSSLGFGLDYLVRQTGGGTLQLGLRAAWTHEFLNPDTTIDAAFATGALAPFSVTAPGLDRDIFNIAPSINYFFNEDLSIYLTYEAQIGWDSFLAHNINGGVRKRF